MRKILLALFFILNFLNADIKEVFPKLDGRVVDQVNLISSNVKDDLNKILKEHEKKTTNQIVVVILKSLNGYEIEDYSYQLGRYWQIGQKEKNNGVLLVVAMEEKKLRIEVGYGLEGALTDKISHEIIEYTLKPNFKAKQYELGILKAINEIIQSIQSEYVSKDDGRTQEEIKSDKNSFIATGIVLLFIIFMGFFFFRFNINLFDITIFDSSLYKSGSNSSSDTSLDSFFDSDNFIGKGGSFGGGGASGSW